MTRLLTLLVLALVSQQAPAGTGLIAGRVLDQSDGRAIAGAVVELVPDVAQSGIPSSGPPRRQMTDAEGRFVFRELPGGPFQLRARVGNNGYSPSGFIVSGLGHPIGAYIPGGFGQRRAGGPLETIVLADSQAMPDLAIRLWRGGAINGTVLDDLGDPLVDTIVCAVRVSTDGRLIDGPTSRTDDRGRYRISALLPGRYVVFVAQTAAALSAEAADLANARIAELGAGQNPAAPPRTMPEITGVRVGSSVVNTESTSVSNNGSLPPRVLGNSVFVFPTTFYPQATTLAMATPVEVGPGEDKNAIDLSLRPAPAVAVSGTILDQGAPAAGVRLRLVQAGSADAELFETATTVTDGRGRFTFPVVPVGNYRLSTLLNTPITRAQGTQSTTVTHSVPHPNGVGSWLDEPVTVPAEGVNGLLCSLKNAFTVTAQIEFVGSSPRPTDQQMERVRLGLRSVGPRGRSDVGNGISESLTSAGAWSIAGVTPGRYTLRVISTPPGLPWRLQSVTASGKELDDVPIEMSGDIEDVRVVFTDRPASVAGRVTFTDPSGGAPSVVLFPADRALWPDARSLTRRFRLARTSVTGDFILTDVPPGEYFAVAILDDVAAAWPDASFIAALAPLAETVRVRPSTSAAVSLTVKAVVRVP